MGGPYGFVLSYPLPWWHAHVSHVMFEHKIDGTILISFFAPKRWEN